MTSNAAKLARTIEEVRRPFDKTFGLPHDLKAARRLATAYEKAAARVSELEAALAAEAAPVAQKRDGRVNKEHVAAIVERSGHNPEAVYDVLWAATDLGYSFVLAAQPATGIQEQVFALLDNLTGAQVAALLPAYYQSGEDARRDSPTGTVCGDYPAPCNCDDPTTHGSH